MVSVYEYTDVEDLENFAGYPWAVPGTPDATEGYSNILAKYTNIVIEAQITQAERIVNVYCHTTFAGTIPDGVVATTLELSKRLMYNLLLEDDQLEDGASEKSAVIEGDTGLERLLSEYILTDSDSNSIDIIPMYRPKNYR